jgi:3-oxo-5-alpha-steroid 4-dehydrogenase 3
MDISNIDLAQLCRAFFILATVATITANSIPQLQEAWVVYGSRRSKAASADDTSQSPVKSQYPSILDYAGGFQVPHSWFTSFYIVSVASSTFWAFQMVTRGSIFLFLAPHGSNRTGGPQATMTINQIAITWLLMALQGIRRLYESTSLSKPSEAKMPILGWAVGIAFYLGVGLSVWVEGIRK